MELLERAPHLVRMAAALREAADGRGCTLLVSGEAGIGKTSLVSRFAEEHAESARFLWGACEALFTPRPFGPLFDLADGAFGPRFRRLLAGDVERAALHSGFLSELQDDAHAPSVVIFEDVHWADEATLDLLKYLGRRIHRMPALLVLTYRDDEVGPGHPLRSLLGDLPNTSVRRLALSSLSEEAVAVLAARAQRPHEGLHAATGGNPFFVTEVLASGSDGVPVSVRDAILGRAARLSPPARTLVDLVSVVPARFERWLLDSVLAAEGSAQERAATVAECASGGMLRVDRHGLTFHHELARRAIEEALSEPHRQLLHARVLSALIDQGGEPGGLARLVHHATLADDGEAVLRYAPAAAREAAALGAHRQAASQFATALAHAQALAESEHAVLLDARAYESFLTGEIGTAIEARREALAIWNRRGERRNEGVDLRWLSRLSWFLGRRKDAEDYADAAIRIFDDLPADSERAMAYSNRSQLHMLAEETEQAVAWGRRAIALAEETGDIVTRVHALNNVGSALLASGVEEGQDTLEESLRLALDHGLEEHAARAYTNLGGLLVNERRYAEADSYLDLGIGYCSKRDLDSWTYYMLGTRAGLAFAQGRWDGAAADAEQVLSRASHPPAIHVQAVTVLGRVRTRRGDPGAEDLLDRAWEVAVLSMEPQRIVPVAAARAEAAWLRGDLGACASEARAGLELCRDRKTPWRNGELAAWIWIAGEKVPAGEYAEPYTLQIEGAWKEAAAAWGRIGCPYEQALCWMEGDEPAQRRALDLLDRLGASPAAQILRRKLRAAGAAKLPRGPRKNARAHPFDLTARQAEILALLVEGLSNAEIAGRLFVSPKTVDHHVSAVLGKLGVRSRIDAVRLAYEHDLGGRDLGGRDLGGRASPPSPKNRESSP